MIRAATAATIVVALAAAAAHGLGWMSLDAAIRLAIAGAGIAAVVVAVRSLPVNRTALATALRDKDEPLGDVREWDVKAVRMVRFSQTSAFDFHAMLKPRLVAVAQRRLEEVGVDPSRRADVEAVLGPFGAWAVDPSVVAPRDREQAGIPAEAVRDLLSRLDSLR